jgi:peptidoglycan-associated lipoprotein
MPDDRSLDRTSSRDRAADAAPSLAARILLGRARKKRRRITMDVRAVVVSCAFALGSLITACGGDNARGKPVSEPKLTNASLKPASPSLNVSEDLARACKLHMNDIASAPKFDFDKSELQAADRDVLAKVAECLTSGPLKGKAVKLVGRADPRGEAQYNMALGANRANGVADYLARLGVDKKQLESTSRGELDAVGTDEAGWQTDRRVDIVLAH